MDPYKETFKTWDKVAELYEEKFMYLDIYNDTYDKLCGYLQKSGNVLDIGCGPGNISKYLINKKPDLNITGIDVSKNMIRLARKNCPSANFKVADCRKILAIEKKFDAIVCGFCLPYLSATELRKIIEDSNYLLNSGGIIYLSFVEGDNAKSGFLTSSTGDRAYFNYYKHEMINDHLNEKRFETLDVFRKEFEKASGEKEMHVIIIGRKL